MKQDPIQDLMQEALQAERSGRFDDARGYLRQALARDETPRALDARLRLGKLLVFGGPPHYAEAEDILTTARVQAEKAGAPRQAAMALHLLALLKIKQGLYPEAQQLLDSSPVPRQTGAPGPETAQWCHYRGLLAANQGDVAHAERLYCRAHQFYQELGDQAGLAEVCDSLAGALLKEGRTRTALTFARRSLALKRQFQDRYGEAITLGTMGRISLLQARYAEAGARFEEDLAIARELNDQAGIGAMLNSLGEAAYLQKDLAAAVQSYEENLAEDRGPYNAVHAHLGLARVYLAAGRLDEAAAACDRMETVLARQPQIHGLNDALDGLRGALAWRRGDFGQGERLLRQAIQGLEQKNQAPDTVPFLYELRDLYHRQGATAHAVAAMARAYDLWSECGAERGVHDVEDWLRAVDATGLIRLVLERHFPKHLVADILAGRLSPAEPRERTLTVLFSDVRGYTALAERLAAREVVELLNDWFTEVTRVVRRHGGLVDKFMGDGVMALFGAPEERPDAAADAVRAAVGMRDALSALNLCRKTLGGPEIRIGIGIDTGPALVGFIGSHLQQSYTAIGDVVNTASRLEGATKDFPGCDILISQQTEAEQQRYRVAETAFLGAVAVKGKRQPVPVFRVLGLRQ